MLALILVLGSTASDAVASRLVVTIEGVWSDRGSVLVALFSRAEGFPDGDFSDRHLKVSAVAAPIVVTFEDVAPGTFAAGAYHDENGNGHLDTTWIGFPAEGYALSNGVRAVLWRPRFKDAAFAVAGDETRITLNIGY